jgi:Uma2 family endonuclease
MELILDTQKRYSYADYLTWLDDKRRELFDGFVSLMSPAPLSGHAKINRVIFLAIGNYLQKCKCDCEVFTAPFDVRLPKNGEKNNNEIFTVVQPDICVICDPSKIDRRGCLGAPDMIVEILSPSTAKKDYSIKFYLYEKAGVREYWIADPLGKFVNVFFLQENGKYDNGKIYEEKDSPDEINLIPVGILSGLEIDYNEIFKQP